MKKIIFPLAFAVSLTASANAAVVTSGFVQNTEANWSHVAGAVASGSTENVPSSRAIDGNYSGVWGNGSVTHTADNGDAGSWWQVDLGAARPITDIALFNRTDCCGGRLANFSVLASNDSTFTTAHIYDSGSGWRECRFHRDRSYRPLCPCPTQFPRPRRWRKRYFTSRGGCHRSGAIQLQQPRHWKCREPINNPFQLSQSNR